MAELLDHHAIRSRTPNFTVAQRSSLQAAIQQLSNIESQVENVTGGSDPPEVPRINQIIARQLDRLAVILVELQGGIEQNKE
jgi:hypothetical protein